MIEIGQAEFKYGDPQTHIRITGLYADPASDMDEVPENPSHKDIGISYFAVGRTYHDSVQNPSEEELKDILREHRVDPERVVEVQRVRVQKTRNKEDD